MVSAYENGTHQPGIETLKRMSEIFNVSVDYLIENSDIRMKSDNLSRPGLSAEEADILALFRELDVKNKQRVFGILFALKNYSSLP